MAEPDLDSIKAMSFESALAELEKIVEMLERGDVALEASIAMYERGAALKQHCEARLKAAELKVEQIVQTSTGEFGHEAASFEP